MLISIYSIFSPDIELSLLHYKRSFRSLENALQSDDPQAVLSLSVLFEIEDTSALINTDDFSSIKNKKASKFFKNLFNSLKKVRKPSKFTN